MAPAIRCCRHYFRRQFNARSILKLLLPYFSQLVYDLLLHILVFESFIFAR